MTAAPQHGTLEVEHPRPGAAVVELLGEHDASTSDHLRETFTSLLATNEVVVADLSQVSFIDSSTLSSLLEIDSAARPLGRTFRLQLGTEAIVRRALEISGVSTRIECCSTREEALAPA